MTIKGGKVADFLDPQNDVVFKIFFTRPKNLPLLISFLESVLNMSSKIKQVTILNPDLPKNLIDDKGIVLDLALVLNDGKRVEVEMQVKNRPGFRRRFLYYWSRLHHSQLKKGKKYQNLSPTFSIAILGYNEFDECKDEVHSIFELRERQTGHLYLPDMALHFIELPKYRAWRRKTKGRSHGNPVQKIPPMPEDSTENPSPMDPGNDFIEDSRTSPVSANKLWPIGMNSQPDFPLNSAEIGLILDGPPSEASRMQAPEHGEVFDHWVQFFKLKNMTEIELAEIEKDPIMAKALNALAEISADSSARQQAEMRELGEFNMRFMAHVSFEDGEKAGIAKGVAKVLKPAILVLAANGTSTSNIAKAFGITEAEVEKYLKKNGKSRKGNKGNNSNNGVKDKRAMADKTDKSTGSDRIEKAERKAKSAKNISKYNHKSTSSDNK